MVMIGDTTFDVMMARNSPDRSPSRMVQHLPFRTKKESLRSARLVSVWEREGRLHRRDIDHWLMAEREALGNAQTKLAPDAKFTGPKPILGRRTAAGVRKLKQCPI
jgi:hypothetical protein